MDNSKFSLRDYQQEAVDTVFKEFDSGIQRLMLVMPTGTGKTTVFSEITRILKAKNKKVLLVVHRTELVNQIVSRLREIHFKVYAGIIAGGSKRKLTKSIQVCSVQSLSENIYENFNPDYIIIDECHHASASTYRRMWDMWPASTILGVTATPIRTDGTGFDDIFQKMSILHQISWYMERGYLVKPEYFVFGSVDPDDIPFDYNKGDFDEHHLRDLFETDARSKQLIDTYREFGGDRKMMVFTTSVERSKELAKLYTEAGYPAAHIDGEINANERAQIIRDFSSGKLRILTNMNIVSEGFDVPDTAVVQIDRLTASLSLYLQIIGRALRTMPGKKYGLVFDHGSNWKVHGWADDHRDWSLTGEEEKEKIQRRIKKSKSKNQDSDEDPNLAFINPNGEIKLPSEVDYANEPVRVIKVNNHLKRLLIFEKFVQECKRKEYDLLKSAFLYRDYLLNNKLEINDVEINYIKKRLPQHGMTKVVNENFWTHYKNEAIVA